MDQQAIEDGFDIPGRGVDGPLFTLSGRTTASGKLIPFTLGAMLHANRDDADTCEWLRSAPVHAELPVGGGAAPLQIIRRIK